MIEPGWRRCCRCKQVKLDDHEHFGKKWDAKDGVSPRCKTCVNEVTYLWRKKNPERYLERKRAWDAHRRHQLPKLPKLPKLQRTYIKITQETIDEIRKQRLWEGVSYRELAAKFKLSKVTLRKIILHTWKGEPVSDSPKSPPQTSPVPLTKPSDDSPQEKFTAIC